MPKHLSTASVHTYSSLHSGIQMYDPCMTSLSVSQRFGTIACTCTSTCTLHRTHAHLREGLAREAAVHEVQVLQLGHIVEDLVPQDFAVASLVPLVQ
jgi:hypothetical protein